MTKTRKLGRPADPKSVNQKLMRALGEKGRASVKLEDDSIEAHRKMVAAAHQAATILGIRVKTQKKGMMLHVTRKP